MVVVLSSVCMHVCLAQDYDEYRPEQRSFNGASRYQFEEDAKTTTTQAPIAILKQINRHNEGWLTTLKHTLINLCNFLISNFF